MPRIQPTRAFISPRFPQLEFLVEAPRDRPFEVVLAADPGLLLATRRRLRHARNFYTSACEGLLHAPAGRGTWRVSPSVLARFGGARRLHYVLAARGPRPGELEFSLPPASFGRAPFVALSLPPRAAPPPPALAQALAAPAPPPAWSGDALPPRARAASALWFDDEEEGKPNTDEDLLATAPPLAPGQVVYIEVRDAAGRITDYSHEYPIASAPGRFDEPVLDLKLPDLPRIQKPAEELTLVTLRQLIADALVKGGLLAPGASVNAQLSPNTVAPGGELTPGTTLHVRILGAGGVVDTASGAYPVDPEGRIDLPYLGRIDIGGRKLGAVEGAIEEALARLQAKPHRVVHLSLVALY